MNHLATSLNHNRDLSVVHKSLALIAVFISFLSAIFLSVESLLSIKGESLCKTEACGIVGKFLIFDEAVLVVGGAFFFWCLFLLLFFSYRYPKQIGGWPLLFLFPALAFDGSLIGFQFFTINQQCALCIGVAISLLCITACYTWSLKKLILLTCSVLIWIGSFTTHIVLDTPGQTGSYHELAFFEYSPKKINRQTEDRVTLFFSMNCSGCQKVLSQLASINPQQDIFSFIVVDQDLPSLKKIQTFRNEMKQKSTNPFSLLASIKNSEENMANVFFPDLRKKSKKAITLLNSLSIEKIPTLIIETSKSRSEFVTGAQQIKDYLNKRYNSNQD